MANHSTHVDRFAGRAPERGQVEVHGGSAWLGVALWKQFIEAGSNPSLHLPAHSGLRQGRGRVRQLPRHGRLAFFNLAETEMVPLFDAMRERGMGYVTMRPYCQGLLTDHWKDTSRAAGRRPPPRPQPRPHPRPLPAHPDRVGAEGESWTHTRRQVRPRRLALRFGHLRHEHGRAARNRHRGRRWRLPRSVVHLRVHAIDTCG